MISMKRNEYEIRGAYIQCFIKHETHVLS